MARTSASSTKTTSSSAVNKPVSRANKKITKKTTTAAKKPDSKKEFGSSIPPLLKLASKAKPKNNLVPFVSQGTLPSSCYLANTLGIAEYMVRKGAKTSGPQKTTINNILNDMKNELENIKTVMDAAKKEAHEEVRGAATTLTNLEGLNGKSDVDYKITAFMRAQNAQKTALNKKLKQEEKKVERAGNFTRRVSVSISETLSVLGIGLSYVKPDDGENVSLQKLEKILNSGNVPVLHTHNYVVPKSTKKSISHSINISSVNGNNVTFNDPINAEAEVVFISQNRIPDVVKIGQNQYQTPHAIWATHELDKNPSWQ